MLLLLQTLKQKKGKEVKQARGDLLLLESIKRSRPFFSPPLRLEELIVLGMQLSEYHHHLLSRCLLSIYFYRCGWHGGEDGGGASRSDQNSSPRTKQTLQTSW